LMAMTILSKRVVTFSWESASQSKASVDQPIEAATPQTNEHRCFFSAQCKHPCLQSSFAQQSC
jgi:hypothetical protein